MSPDEPDNRACHSVVAGQFSGMLAVMYKTFEGIDQLQNMVERAYGVPMTANCMVPRGEAAELLDMIRNSIPGDLDDAQDVLDREDAILSEAEDKASALVAEAEAERDRILDEARQRAEDMIADAEERAQSTVARAEAEAVRLEEDARREYQETTSRADAEKARLIEEGNNLYDRAVNEGIAEQRRLVSESEVVREADAEARRIIESAHADSDRLRRECDQYVDSTLAQFEESLNGSLRTVSRDRSALRKGAGVSGNRYPREPRDGRADGWGDGRGDAEPRGERGSRL
jgi:cell division septum initiation protein DivIVA